MPVRLEIDPPKSLLLSSSFLRACDSRQVKRVPPDRWNFSLRRNCSTGRHSAQARYHATKPMQLNACWAVDTHDCCYAMKSHLVSHAAFNFSAAHNDGYVLRVAALHSDFDVYNRHHGQR